MVICGTVKRTIKNCRGTLEMEALAINGGIPVREKRIGYGRQWIDKDDIKAVEEVLKGDFLTCGPHVEKLEKKLCEYTGAKYAVAVSNGTAALHCACIAAGIGTGDEVITTPITFAASSNCVLYCGGTPVFADINPKTYNIDPQSIRKKITNKTKAIIAVDFTGQAVELDEIRNICKEFNLILIEDAAHSIGTVYNGTKVGNIADMTTMSFHPVKTVTSGEGGAILTNDEGLYQKLLLAHTHGITHDEDIMENPVHEGPWEYEQVSLGYNYRITDIQSALLISQLNKIDIFKARRKEIVHRYNEAFGKIPELIIQEEISESDTCRHLYILQLNLEKLKCSRSEFFDALLAEGIGCQVHYIPVYYFPYYRKLGYEKGLCPNAENLYEKIMSIPLFPKMSDSDVEDVIKAVKKCVEAYRK